MLRPAAPRLACVKPPASVHPEPGSNSPLYIFLLYIFRRAAPAPLAISSDPCIKNPGIFFLVHFFSLGSGGTCAPPGVLPHTFKELPPKRPPVKRRATNIRTFFHSAKKSGPFFSRPSARRGLPLFSFSAARRLIPSITLQSTFGFKSGCKDTLPFRLTKTFSDKFLRFFKNFDNALTTTNMYLQKKENKGVFLT